MLDKGYKTIFQQFKVSDKDLELYAYIAAEAKSFDEMEKIINHFMSNYVVKMDSRLSNLVRDTLTVALSTELIEKELSTLVTVFTSISTDFTSSSKIYENVLKANFAVIADIVGSKGVELAGGTNVIEKELVSMLIEKFDQRITGAMAMTRQDVLTYVRQLQREMIIRNAQLHAMAKDGVINSIIEKEKAKFKSDMLKKYPHLKKMFDEAKILKSRSWLDSDGVERHRSYTLADYNEMATSETLKNIDRDAVEMIATYYNEPVVEFYLRDNRHVEMPNDACSHIMSKKIDGKVLLATSNYVANLLGIWTIDKAKSEHSLEISRHCRHSIRRIEDEAFIEKINKLIAVSKTEEVA